MNFEKIKINLEKMGYKVTCTETGAQAADYMAEIIKDTTVGIGGCMTAKQIGLYEKLSVNNDVNWHWMPKPDQTMQQAYAGARNAKIYILSANGIAETGEIINIDGSGNRVAEATYGHEKVYFIIGKNKIAPDFEQAMWRARNIAAPKNSQRLGLATPCSAKGDRCYNCSSPARICNSFSVFMNKPRGCEYEIILINEDLGY